MNSIIRDALGLLDDASPITDEIPATIEQLEIAAFDLRAHINDLQDRLGLAEESACIESAGESNETKRKARRAEILRADEGYNFTRQEIREHERVCLQLHERSSRLRRDFRAQLLNREINHLGRRS